MEPEETRVPRQLQASEQLIAEVDAQFAAIKAAYGNCYESIRIPLEQIRSAYHDENFKTAVDACYETSGDSKRLLTPRRFHAKGEKVQVKLGLVESLESLSVQLSHIVPVALRTKTGYCFTVIKKEEIDLVRTTMDTGEVLRRFSNLLEKFKCDPEDIVWLHTVATIVQLAPYIRTELPIDQWPEVFVTERGHPSRHRESNGHLVVYSVKEKKDRKIADWLMRVPSDEFRKKLKELFQFLLSLEDDADDQAEQECKIG